MVEYNPYAYEVHEDPFPVYRALRDEAPLYRNEALGFWALSRHADVQAAIRDPARYSSANGVTLDPAATGDTARLAMSFLAMDPPLHTKMRALVSRGFTPRRVSELAPRIREICVAYLEEIAPRGRYEFIEDFAGRVPMDVISELLGVPTGDRAELRTLADTLVHRPEGAVDVPPEGVAAFGRIRSYFKELVEEREKRRRDDLISALLDAEVDGERLGAHEILPFCNLMIVAGNETTTKLLANALYWLWKNPRERGRVAADPTLIPRWVEETLRYDNSTQMLARTVSEEHELHGRKLAVGDKLLLLIGSANRDERVFEGAERYDILRNTTASLAFGQGAHFCLGASLARLEGRIALEEIWKRMPDYEVLPGGLERVHSVNVRGFSRMPLEFTP